MLFAHNADLFNSRLTNSIHISYFPVASKKKESYGKRIYSTFLAIPAPPFSKTKKNASI